MRIGPYEVLGELGRGGMGTVYRVRAPDGREAALKLLVAVQPASIARFERERRLLASLGEAQGFVGLLDAGVERGGAWLVMPLVTGGTLRERLARGPLGAAETVALGVTLATALGAAHERGIVHRDVKPTNILFTSDARPLVADLGLAKHFDRAATGASESLSLTTGGVFKGTAGYMAPEQITDAASAGPPADVFALGAVLYECLAGRPAFRGETVLEVLALVGSGAVAPIGVPGVPPSLEAAIRRALSVDPEERFADGAIFARALRGESVAGTGRSRLAPIVVVASVLVLGALVLTAFRSRRSEAPPSPSPPPSATLPPPPPVAVEGPLPEGLRRAGTNVPAADGKEVPLFLFRLPDGSDMEMVQVPKGDFLMGSDDPEAYESERPRHAHPVDHAFWIGRNDVTLAEYRSFCSRSGREAPDGPDSRDKLEGTAERHPVVRVSWEDARAYASWARLELPLEAEWEKAARGTDGRRWPWGDVWDPGSRCNFADASCPLDTIDWGGGKKLAQVFEENGWTWDRAHDDGHAFTSPVGTYPRGASPCGALDMAGNVWQWCQDWYDAKVYARYDRNDFAPPKTGVLRVTRGGCWGSTDRYCRCSNRGWLAPGLAGIKIVGFRVVLRAR